MAIDSKFTTILSIIFVILIVFMNTLGLTNAKLSHAQTPEDARLNFTELATKYGHECKEYDVTTEDGYILKMFNIEGNNDTEPVLLLHGLFDTSNTYIIRGDHSIAINLANRNKSVWAGNFRGNTYSRKHKTLNPDKNRQFWDFSFHEMGYYDLPAMIDFVLEKTGQSKLQIIAHSLGTTCTYVLSSTRPEYDSKVTISISMAPIAHLQNVKCPASLIIAAGSVLNLLFSTAGQEEILKNSSHIADIYKKVCTVLSAEDTCGAIIETAFTGYDEDTFAGDFFPIALANFPSGTSRMNVNHVFQISNNNRFAQYDYGMMKNLFVYKWHNPPVYNLDKANMKFALLVAQNDMLSTIPDTEWLRDELPSVVYYKVLDREQMNHVDFVWGASADQYLFPYLFDLLEKYK